MSNTPKIGFAGSHGVGKTTMMYGVANYLKRNDVELSVVSEVARDCPLPINHDGSIQSQRWILFTQIAREEAKSKDSHDAVLTDRTALDNIAYTNELLGGDELSEDVARRWMETYDLIFLFANNPDFLTDDGERPQGAEFQQTIHDEVEGLMDSCCRDKIIEVDGGVASINDLGAIIHRYLKIK